MMSVMYVFLIHLTIYTYISPYNNFISFINTIQLYKGSCILPLLVTNYYSRANYNYGYCTTVRFARTQKGKISLLSPNQQCQINEDHFSKLLLYGNFNCN